MKYNNREAVIYSRPKVKFLVNNKIKENKNQPNSNNTKIRKVIAVIMIAAITATLIIKSINPIIDKLCINEAQNIATTIANRQATNIMQNYSYDDLITVVRDKDNNITMIQANTKTINGIISEIPIKILDDFKDNSNSNIYIYLGSLLGLKTFSGAGPKITAKIANTSNIKTTLKSEFTSAGINQTLHRIYLEINLDVSILTPYNSINTNITDEVLLAESVIIGNVPSSYYYLNNASTNDALKVTNK